MTFFASFQEPEGDAAQWWLAQRRDDLKEEIRRGYERIAEWQQTVVKMRADLATSERQLAEISVALEKLKCPSSPPILTIPG